MKIRVFALVFVFGTTARSLVFSQSVTLGPEIPVTAPGSPSPDGPSVAGDGQGNFVVAWLADDGSGRGVFARRFDAFGSPNGEAFQVNTYTTSNQYFQAISMDPSGNFVVAWSSVGQDGSADAVIARRYSSSGVPFGGEFQVNSYTPERQYRPTVGTDDSGGFVVCWTSTGGQDGFRIGVFGQRYSSSGDPQEAEFQVNQYTTGDQFGPNVAVRSDGSFVVAWSGTDEDGSGEGVFARRYAADGSPLGDEFQVNTYTTDNERIPSVGMFPGGDFVVSWESKDAQDGSAYGVFAQRFDANGNAQGDEFQVNAQTVGYQVLPAAAADEGMFIVTWRSDRFGGPGTEVVERIFDASANPLGAEFPLSNNTSADDDAPKIARVGPGTFATTWLRTDTNGPQIVLRIAFPVVGSSIAVDAHTTGLSDMNGVLEPGETVIVEPSWQDTSTVSRSEAGFATLAGPVVSGTTYTVVDDLADYGTLMPDTPASCYSATQDCYQVMVSGPRPVSHWDATLTEMLSSTATRDWTIHVGDSFTDVPRDDPFYGFVENLFHNRVTTGCTGNGQYCPANAVTRAQMAVFLLKAKHGADFQPPSCLGFFTDVDCPGPFTDWIEELAAEGITGGCGPGLYCPSTPVRRDQMAAFLLKAEHGSSYVPPQCVGQFTDVTCPSLFADWVEQLAAEQVTGGCGSGNYCPLSSVTRGQMAVFLVKTFGLLLYGP